MDLKDDLILIDYHMISYTYTLAIIYVLSYIKLFILKVKAVNYDILYIMV